MVFTQVYTFLVIKIKRRQLLKPSSTAWTYELSGNVSLIIITQDASSTNWLVSNFSDLWLDGDHRVGLAIPLHWRRKLEKFEGDGDEKNWAKGGYPLENSSVLAHIPMDHFATFSLFLYSFLYFSVQFFFFLGILRGTSPHYFFFWGGRHVPRFRRLCTSQDVKRCHSIS